MRIITLGAVRSAVTESLFHPGGTLSLRQAAEKLKAENPNAQLSKAVKELLEIK